jgi:hypothetical protein
VLVRAPPAPPGRTATVTTGQSTPGVQTGSVAIVQVSRRLVPPVETVAQDRPVATPVASATETSPRRPRPTLLLMRPVSSSVSVIESRRLRPRIHDLDREGLDLARRDRGERGGLHDRDVGRVAALLPSTVTEVVSLPGLVSGMFASGELTVMLFVIVPVAVAVVGARPAASSPRTRAARRR